MTRELIEQAKKRFQEAAGRLEKTAEMLDQLDVPALEAVTRQSAAELAGLRADIAGARLPLPDGREIELREFAALAALARDNRSDEQAVLAGVREIQQGRIVSADFGRLNLSDVSALAGLMKLEVLWLSNNRISDIRPLAGLAELRELDLNDNCVPDLGALGGGLSRLSSLYLGNNQLREIRLPSGLTRLEYIGLTGNPLSETAERVLEELRDRGICVDFGA